MIGSIPPFYTRPITANDLLALFGGRRCLSLHEVTDRLVALGVPERCLDGVIEAIEEHPAIRKDEDMNFTWLRSGAELIAAERARQVAVEGWTADHDDVHDAGELTDAAIAYAESAGMQIRGNCGWDLEPGCWPWLTEWWKPSADPIRNLIKAGALIAAEIDRLQRKEGK